MKIIKRLSEERGHEELSWLDTYYTFSFSAYFDNKFTEFGCLRVLNEDIVKPKKGFGSHPQNLYEIITLVLNGDIEHTDSLNNIEIIKKGQVQFTSSGSGIYHSEKNGNNNKDLHILQIWVKPNLNNKDNNLVDEFYYSSNEIQPKYFTWKDDFFNIKNEFIPIISPFYNEKPKINDSIGILSHYYLFFINLESFKNIKYEIKLKNEKVKIYVHFPLNNKNLQLKILNEDLEVNLNCGDGAFITEIKSYKSNLEFINNSESTICFVLMELI